MYMPLWELGGLEVKALFSEGRNACISSHSEIFFINNSNQLTFKSHEYLGSDIQYSLITTKIYLSTTTIIDYYKSTSEAEECKARLTFCEHCKIEHLKNEHLKKQTLYQNSVPI
jgi:hypothetical protein